MMGYLLKTLIYIDLLAAAALLLFRWALIARHRDLVSARLSAIVLITPMVALFSGNVYFLYAYLGLAMIASARSRLSLAGAFLFLLPTMPLLPVDTVVGGVYLFAITTPIAMAIGAAIGMMMTRAATPAAPRRYDLAVAFVIVLFTFIDHHDFEFTGIMRTLAVNVFTIGVPYLLVSRVARTFADVENMLLHWMAGAAVMAVATCFQAWRHWVLFEAYNSALHIPLPMASAATAVRAGFLRTGGAMVDYTAGGVLLAAIVTVLPLVRRAFGRGGYALVMLIFLLALFFTQSRGAWVAAIAGAALVAAWQGKWLRIVVLAAVAAVGDVAVSVLAPNGSLAQMLGKAGHAETTASYRKDLLSDGLQQIRNHPLLGQSVVSLQNQMADLKQGQHIVDFVNTHLFVAMAAGVPMFVLWCCVWLMPIMDGWRRRRAGILLAVAPIAIVVPTLVALIFTSPIDRNLSWLVIGFALAVPCMAALRRRPQRSALAGSPLPPLGSAAGG